MLGVLFSIIPMANFVAFGYFFFGDASTYKISPELTTIELKKIQK